MEKSNKEQEKKEELENKVNIKENSKNTKNKEHEENVQKENNIKKSEESKAKNEKQEKCQTKKCKCEKNKKILYIIIAIVILASAIVGAIFKFNFSLAYDTTNKIEVYLGKDFEKSDVQKIAEDVWGSKDVMVQKIEFFNDSFALTVRGQNDEQLTNFANKLNEKYGTSLTKDSFSIVGIPHYRGRDVMQRYIEALVVASILVILYEIVKYRKLGVLKVLVKTVIWPIIIEALYLSIIALTRLPISYYTLPLGIILGVVTVTFITWKNENELEKLEK